MKRAFNLIRCGIALYTKKYCNSLKRYRQSIIHVLQFHTFQRDHIDVFFRATSKRNVTLFFAGQDAFCIVMCVYLSFLDSQRPLSVLQHRTRYQTGIHINAISLKRLHVVNKIGGFRRCLGTKGRWCVISLIDI